jgi:hypothetical protein
MRRIKAMSSPLPDHVSVPKHDLKLLLRVARAAELNYRIMCGHINITVELEDALDALNKPRKQK